MTELARAAAGWLFLGAGSLFSLVGAIGLLRLPDFYARIHGAGITDTLGAGLVLLGLITQSTDPLVVAKLVMIGLLLWFTSPTATHALARAALERGLEPQAEREDR